MTCPSVLYAIGVVGAVAVNIGACSTNRRLALRVYERRAMLLLTGLMVAIWFTIAWEKPWALLFAMSIVGAGLVTRWTAHNRSKVWDWFLAPVPTLFPTPEIAAPIRHAPVVTTPALKEPASTAARVRLMVATRGNSRLIRFALEEAKVHAAELYVLFVRHIAVPTLGPVNMLDAKNDTEASEYFERIKAQAQEEGIEVQFVYAVAYDVAEAILETAATYAVDSLILGTSQRGALWRTMKGDVIQEVAQYLPDRINLIIQG